MNSSDTSLDHWGERGYADDYVNELMVDTSDRDSADVDENGHARSPRP